MRAPGKTQGRKLGREGSSRAFRPINPYAASPWLGTPTTESSQVQFETVTTGDPSYAGPLTRVDLGLPAYDVFEPNVKTAIDPDQYAENIEILEMGLEAGAIVSALAGDAGGVDVKRHWLVPEPSQPASSAIGAHPTLDIRTDLS